MMKKNLVMLSVLVMSLMMVGVVSAATVDIVSPEGYINEDDVLIEWENGDFEIGWLKYKEGPCNGASGKLIKTEVVTGDGEYSWDISDLEEGLYCIKITGNTKIYGSVEIVIDRENPEAEITDTENGDEKDEAVQITIEIDDDNEIDECEIDWGDGESEDCATTIGEHDVRHQYADDGEYNVILTVTDGAGNEDSDSTEVSVENVAPWGVGIDAPLEAIAGEDVSFEGDAEDVEADEEDLVYTWDFGDETDEETGEEVSHVYDEAGEYEVTLTVTDGDDEAEPATHTIKIVETAELDDQEVLVNEVEVYETDVEAVLDCAPVNKEDWWDVERDAEGKCKITFSPTNENRGVHHITIKTVGNGFEYYSFDVTVYSWMIELDEGWNLFSIPLVPESTYYKDVLEGIRENLDTVWSHEYDTSTEESNWHGRTTTATGWSTASSKNFGDLQNIVPGRSYYVNMKAPDVLKGFGDKVYPYPTEESSSVGIPEIALPTNQWTLIGTFGLDILSDDDALKSLEGTFTLVDGMINMVNNLNPTGGYWLWVKNYDVDEEAYTPLNEEYYL